MKIPLRTVIIISVSSVLLSFLLAEERGPRSGGGPPTRKHTKVQSKGTSLVRSNNKVRQKSEVKIVLEGQYRIITSNGIPDHLVGAFPNRGNPHSIQAQKHRFKIPKNPIALSEPQSIGMQMFGIAVNGVPFDPSAAEWYLGERNSSWQYEALSGAVPLGVDQSHAHVQPTGIYHYHGLPQLLLKDLKVQKRKHSPIVGWAADGYPIYAKFGYSKTDDVKSKIVELKSSYRLKKGSRPKGSGAPGGRYDGTFTADYEYVEGYGDLDKCNGRFAVTPEMPEGGYAYYLTEAWPVIPRFYQAKPSTDFNKGPNSGGSQRRGPPGFGPPPPRR